MWVSPSSRIKNPYRVMGLAQAKAGVETEKLLDGGDLLGWANAIGGCVETEYRHPKTDEYGYAIRCNDDPESIAIATDVLVRHMQELITRSRRVAGDRTLVWKTKPEIDTWRGEIAEYRDDGPDIDQVTDKRCVLDRTVVYVKSYARFGFI